MIPLCQTLALLPTPAVDGATTCLLIEVDLAGRLEQNWPDDGISTMFTLPRSRLELGVSSAQYRGRVAFTAARSGGLSSTTGINGEALVSELQIAEAAWLGPGITLAAGLIDDPWVATGNTDWGLRAAAPVLSEAVGWLDRSDLGASAAWSARSEVFAVIATLTSGEGARYSERNNGKNTTIVLIGHPIPDRPEVLALSLLGRDGSRGLDSARNHRAGARITGSITPVRLGGEVLATWGVDGDIDRTPLGFSIWTEASLPLALSVFGRLDQTSEATADSTTSTLRGGLTCRQGPLQVILGAERTKADAQAVPVAGADSLSSSTTAYVLVGIQQGGSVVLNPL